MQSLELKVSPRDTARSAKSLRRGGTLPGVFYGAGGANIAVEVDEHTFTSSRLGSHGAHLIMFSSSNSALDKSLALVREVQHHPVTGAPLHVDFLRIDVNKPVQARVALSYVGQAVGVVAGGILQPIRRDLEVQALPAHLPEAIVVDISSLEIHDVIHVEDLTLPEGVQAIFSENFTLVTVVPPVVEKEPEEAEAIEGEAAEAGEEGAAEAEGEGDEGNKGNKDSKK